MIFTVIFCATVLGAASHLVLTRSQGWSRARVVEICLLYILSVQWGFGAILTSLPHILVPDYVANYVGWEAGSPFQVELGFLFLGTAIVGVLCIWFRGWFWLAPVVSMSVFLLGAAWVHVQDILTRGNLSPGNAGPVLFFDIVVPILAVSLFIAHVRMGGMENAERRSSST